MSVRVRVRNQHQGHKRVAELRASYARFQQVVAAQSGTPAEQHHKALVLFKKAPPVQDEEAALRNFHLAKKSGASQALEDASFYFFGCGPRKVRKFIGSMATKAQLRSDVFWSDVWSFFETMDDATFLKRYSAYKAVMWNKKPARSPRAPRSRSSAGPAYVAFYDCRQWLTLRYMVIECYGRECMACGRTSGEMHVDHIVPRSKDRSRELDPDNLQVLCRECNLGKCNYSDKDYRTPEQLLSMKLATAGITAAVAKAKER